MRSGAELGKVKIAIAGPGRSGTSLLVQLFGHWGFHVPSEPWHQEAQAGLEVRLGSNSPYEVEKDPFAYEYFDRLPLERIAEFRVLIVPIRSRRDAVISRSVQERLKRIGGERTDYWRWNSAGWAPGGAVADTSAAGINSTLANGLWDLLEAAARKSVSVRLLHFPRFAADFDYLWSQLSDVVGERRSEEQAKSEWLRVVDTDRIHRTMADDEDIRVQELELIVEKLRTEMRRRTDSA